MSNGASTEGPVAGAPAALAEPSVPPPRPRVAWQPFTPSGVAAFSRASFGRVLVLQTIMAILAAGIMIWFLHAAWLPTLRAAIKALPAQGVIQGGELRLDGPGAIPLASTRPFLSVSVEITSQGNTSFDTDLTLVFRRRGFQICSLLGCFYSPYPADRLVLFNRTDVEPWWSAWEPAFLGIITMACMLWLLLAWITLASIYCPFVRLFAYFADRQLTLGGSWRLCVASLMPGTLFFLVALVLYGLGTLDLVHFLICAVAHLAVPWIYLIAAPLTLPYVEVARVSASNPFTGAPTAENPSAESSSPPEK